MSSTQNPIIRRPKAAISLSSFNVFHLRNPLVVAWWSLVYPGFGHLREISILKGVFLFVGELFINTQGHINMAIIYSFTGHFTMAKQVLDTHLLLLYCGILVFAVWESYRIAVELNKASILADHENASMTPTVFAADGVNYFEKRNPWVAVAWSMLVPGAGHLYCQSIIVAFFMVVGATVIIYLSHLLPAIGYTALGQFAQAKAVLDWQWLLNMPSFYCFAIYDAYVKSVEINKTFDIEQAQFLRNNYQSSGFLMPSKSV
ncbi:MAG: hypothetical protein ABFD08_16180 [Syntrophomonas sp.]